ncbi:MAG: MBL fold metallo-hydrolase [Candidatus Odinarchaeota archaeon]
MVTVKWLGHACFEIKGDVTVVTDPHDGVSLGIKPPQSKADIVLITHSHYDHADGLPLVRRDDTVVLREFVGERNVKGVNVRGVKTFHDTSKGAQRGLNVIYLFEMAGMRFLHLGDLGHVLGSDIVESVKPVDVLFVPVGGTYTLDHSGATKIYNEIKPRITIPMHYKISGLNLPLSSVDTFLAGKAEARRLGVNFLEISREKLPKTSEIIALTV